MKDFGPDAMAAIASGRVMSVGAVHIATSPDVLALWGGYGELELPDAPGVTFLGIGDRGLIRATGAALGGADQGISLELSGVDPALLPLIDPLAAKRAAVVCWRLLFDTSGTQLLAAPIFTRGRVDQVKVREVPGGTATITCLVEGAVRGLGRAGGRMRSDADQRLCDPDDEGFAGVSHAGETVIYWGGKPGQTSQEAFVAQPIDFSPAWPGVF